MAVISAPEASAIYEAADSTDSTLDPGTARVLDGLRLVLVVHDHRRAEVLTEELQKRGVAVGRLEAYTGADLAPIRELDPEVVLFDPAALGAAGLALTRALNADDRLRWTSVLRCDFDKLWGPDEELPDLRRLASLLAPLVDAERSLRHRVRSEGSVVTELDRIGPNRTLRVLEAAGGAFMVKAQAPEARAELGVEDGAVVTATFETVDQGGPPVTGESAVTGFMGLRAGLLEIERIARAPSPRDDTRRGGPSPRLLDESRLTTADPDTTEKTAPIQFDEAELLSRPTDPMPRFERMSQEPTRNVHLATKPTSDREETRQLVPPSAFALPSLMDADYGETIEEEAWTSPVVKPYRPGQEVKLENAPPSPPKPSLSPRESAERGSTLPPKQVRKRVDTLPQHGAAKPKPKKRNKAIPKPTPLAIPRARIKTPAPGADEEPGVEFETSPTPRAPRKPTPPPEPIARPVVEAIPVPEPEPMPEPEPTPAPAEAEPAEDIELDEAPTNPHPPPAPPKSYATRAATEVSPSRGAAAQPESRSVVIWVAAATILVAAIGIALGMVTAGEDLSGEDAVAVAPVTGAGAEAVPADHGDEPTDDGPASVPAPADHGDEPLDDEQPRPDARREASPPTDESETVPADHGDEPLDDEQPRPDAQREASPPTDGSEPATPDPQRADALIAQAEELELPDAGEEALALYQQAFEIDPRAHEALAGMAEVYLETGRAAVAVRYAERAHRRSTRRVSYLILLGDAYLANHDIRAAQQAWLEAWELRPSERIRRRLDRVGRAPE